MFEIITSVNPFINNPLLSLKLNVNLSELFSLDNLKVNFFNPITLSNKMLENITLFSIVH